MKKKTFAESPWPVIPHEREGEAEEDGGDDDARAAAGGACAGVCGAAWNLCVVVCSPTRVYIDGFSPSPTRSLSESY